MSTQQQILLSSNQSLRATETVPEAFNIHLNAVNSIFPQVYFPSNIFPQQIYQSGRGGGMTGGGGKLQIHYLDS